MAESLNIYQKLAKIRKQVEVMQKNKSGYNYKYVTDEEILAKVTAFIDKYGLSLIPMVVQGTMKHDLYHYLKTKFDKNTKQLYDEHNNEIIVSADMVFCLVNNENPDERIEIPWGLIGQQADSSQAFGSGLTYAMRYFLLKYFNIATPEDDPDNWRSKQRAAEAAEDKAIAKQIISQLEGEINSYLSTNPKSKDKVKELVSKYVKDGNYFAITESALASKLLSDFNETFINKEEK